MKRVFSLFMLFCVLGLGSAAITGCEASGKIDDDGVEVDIDD
jgi:hypothetical protein